MSKNISVWLIIPQTNLHVGNESMVSFDVIDKAIQRDVRTKLPCINSGSLKGALKEYLSESEKLAESNIQDIFGSSKTNKNDVKKGGTIFFDANILFIPEQCSDSNCLYKLAYSKKVLQEFIDKAKMLGAEYTIEAILNKVKAEVKNDHVADTPKPLEDFQYLCSDEALPIIARNCLDNGESVNLWYEQVLPSLSVLGAIIETNNADDLNKLDGKIVQIGANATIGYGYCKFVKL